jgi:DNA-binding XRE family transcriptional regulator
MKQYEFAEAADVSPHSYNQWERGAVYLPVDGAIKLCKAHGLTLDWLYLGKPDCLPTHLFKAIEALTAAQVASPPTLKIVQPRQRKKVG